jgi:hypothetical protein
VPLFLVFQSSFFGLTFLQFLHVTSFQHLEVFKDLVLHWQAVQIPPFLALTSPSE